VELRCLVLKLKISQVAHVAEKESLEPMAEQVITMEPELSLRLFVECSLHLTNIQNWIFGNPKNVSVWRYCSLLYRKFIYIVI